MNREPPVHHDSACGATVGEPATVNLVVLDGHTLNPGDLSWEALRAVVGPCTIHERTPPAAVVARAADAALVLTNKVILSREVLEQLPRLRYIGVLATGYNVVDIEAARERGIRVTNVPGYSTASVVQLTMGLLLELAWRIGDHATGVRQGRWTRSPDFAYWDHPLVELAGRRLGVVGFGQIGRGVAAAAAALGLQVCAHTRTRPTSPPPAVAFVDLDPLLRESDVVSLHCPLTPETRHLVNADRLRQMKPGAWLINTARGPLVDEVALADALNAGRLGGAAMDVLSTEPPPASNPLLQARNCVITPHIGWATTAARSRLMHEVVENVRAFLRGAARHVVV